MWVCVCALLCMCVCAKVNHAFSHCMMAEGGKQESKQPFIHSLGVWKKRECVCWWIIEYVCVCTTIDLWWTSIKYSCLHLQIWIMVPNWDPVSNSSLARYHDKFVRMVKIIWCWHNSTECELANCASGLNEPAAQNTMCLILTGLPKWPLFISQSLSPGN